MKTIRILALAAALAAIPTFASDFGHEQALTIDGKPPIWQKLQPVFWQTKP